jgi:murein DD-endopeptidase MepM/ murein hydrolase activator NlpD
MDDSTFDPRSWGKPVPAKSADGTRNPVTAPEGEGVESALPEAWRGIGTSFVPGNAAASAGEAGPTVPSGHESARASRRQALAMGGSLVILVGGGIAAWFTRSPATIAAATGGKAASPAAAAMVERSLKLGSTGEIASALTAFGVLAPEAAAVSGAVTGALSAPGEVRLRAELLPQGSGFAVQRLQASYADGSGAVVTRDAGGNFSAAAIAADLSKQIKILRGELDSESFYSSAVSTGLVDALIPEFINAFAYDFNLASEIAPGDTFEVAFEQSVNGDGDAVGQPQLLYALLTTAAKSLALYRFRNSAGEVGWFDGNGATTKRGLMRTPVDGARITSKFGMRFHPVLHYNKLHGGTDFAAPIGTPIYAAADGVVEWAAMKGANGNLTIVKHDNGWATYYLHQNRFMPGIAAGVRVTQGEHIGDIGTTGRSTGPHLHYEVHIDGERVDPLEIKTDDGARKKIEGVELAAFLRERDRIDVARTKQSV